MKIYMMKTIAKIAWTCMLFNKIALNLAQFLTTMCASSFSRTVNMKIFAGVADGSVVIFKRNQGIKEENYLK